MAGNLIPLVTEDAIKEGLYHIIATSLHHLTQNGCNTHYAIFIQLSVKCCFKITKARHAMRLELLTAFYGLMLRKGPKSISICSPFASSHKRRQRATSVFSFVQIFFCQLKIMKTKDHEGEFWSSLTSSIFQQRCNNSIFQYISQSLKEQSGFRQ